MDTKKNKKGFRHQELLEDKARERTAELEKVNRQLRREIEERVQAEKLLQESENKFRIIAEKASDEKDLAEGIVNSLPGIFYIFDKDGKLKRWNQNFEQVTGYTADEIVGKCILRLFDVDEVALVKKAIRQTYNGNGTEIEANLISKDGKKTPYYFTGTAINYNGQRYVMGMGLEITERKQAENAVKLYARKLKKLNASKDKFFSILAHDLRSPFSGLIGLSELLVSESDSLSNAEIKEYACKINASSNKVFQLLNNLLEWSRIQINGTELHPEHLLLADLVHRSCETLQDNVRSKKIDLMIEVDRSIKVYADRNMLSSVFQNLISNSIKFSNKNGQIVVKAEDQEDQTLVSIADSGMGMSRDVLNSLFKLELTISTKGTNDEQGSGLGLILCKEFIEKHGGEIWVKSKKGNGATFYFTIPKTMIML